MAGVGTACELEGQFPDDAVIDQRSRTLYVANTPSDVLGTLSMIDLTTCNVHATRGCRDVAPTTPIGTAVLEFAADPSLRTIYAASQEDSSVSVIDERRCNATNTSGCRRFPLTMSGGFSSGGAAVDTATHTVYLSSQSENNLTVLDGTRCNGLVTLGCTRRAPVTATGVGPQGPALSAELGTLYVSNQLSDTVSVIDVHACSAEHLVGCRRSWPTLKVGAFPKAIGLDPPTHTAYVANYYGNSVSVVDTATCNAKNTAGCGRRAPEIAVPGGAYTLVVDPSTHTVYVAGVDDGTVSVIDGSTCNAQSHSGCDQTPTAVPVGDPSGLVLDHATRTLFVADRTNGVVSVLDADTCNGRDTSGCAVVATTPVGTTPRFMAVDDGTGTLYVANKDSDTLSLVDLVTCSAQSPAGCGGASPAVPVGHLPYGVAVDHRSGVVYIGDVGDSTLASFETASCNAHDQSACGLRRAASTGGWPTNLVVAAADRTVYVADNVDAQLSVVQAR